MSQNPFKLKGYHGTELFCDRVEETQKIIENAQNDVNTTLYSVRRMGKTGLIHHVFSQIEASEVIKCIYLDIYATENLEGFTQELAQAILKVYPQNRGVGKKFLTLLKSLSPTLSYDQFTGNPSIGFDFKQTKQYEQTVKSLLNFVDTQEEKVLIAIDEFQQILNYPETNIEAILRTSIQSLQHTNFVFCGSHHGMISAIFNDSKRPFYSSTLPIYLNPIKKDEYESFIAELFRKYKKVIDQESIDFILEWTHRHTYYTQALCNKVFALSGKKISIKNVQEAALTILLEYEPIFFQYRSLLTSSQWDLLVAIAKKDTVEQPTSFEFISTYKLSSPSTVKRSLDALLQKEMVLQLMEDDQKYYRIYDVFLGRWMERKSF